MQNVYLVWANPWHAIDHLGRPCGAATMRADKAGAPRHIGARRVLTPVLGENGRPQKAYDGIRDTVNAVSWEFSADPVALPITSDGYHRKLIAQGAVLPADQDTANAAGVPFLPYDQAMTLAKSAANAGYRRLYGKDLPGFVAPPAKAKSDKEVSK